MTMKRNLVAHYKGGTSDKVYMVSIRENEDGSFSVLGKRGRTGKTMQFQLKGSFRTKSEAVGLQISIFREKLAKGYQDISSSSYHGPVTFNTPQITSNLEPESELESVKDDVKEEIAKAKKQENPVVGFERNEFTVVCVDNTGIESRFDVGIEYMAEKHIDRKMVNVFDKFGTRDEFFRERFALGEGDGTGEAKFYQPKPGDKIRMIR